MSKMDGWSDERCRELGELVLRKAKVVGMMQVGPTFADSLGCEVVADMMGERLLLKLKGWVLEHDIRREWFEMPSTWWDHFKRDRLPRWMWRKPPRMVTAIRRTVRMYPQAKVILPAEEWGKPLVRYINDTEIEEGADE